MCKELEDIGLPDPVFNNSTFILKTTVMSATYQKLPFEKEKVSDSDIITKAREKYRPIKLSLEAYTQAYTEKSYNTSTILNLQAIYDQIEVNRVFNSTYLMKILNCSDRGARLREQLMGNNHLLELLSLDRRTLAKPPDWNSPRQLELFGEFST